MPWGDAAQYGIGFVAVIGIVYFGISVAKSRTNGSNGSKNGKVNNEVLVAVTALEQVVKNNTQAMNQNCELMQNMNTTIQVGQARTEEKLNTLLDRKD